MQEVRSILPDPRNAKMRLAHEIVKIYHGEKEADAARENFEKVFSKKEVPDKIKVAEVKENEMIVDIMIVNSLAGSKSEARRKIEQGGVKLDGRSIEDWTEKATKEWDGKIIKVGKREFLKIAIV